MPAMTSTANIKKKLLGVGLRTLSRQDALRARAADAIELRSICQRCFLMVLILLGDDGRLYLLKGLIDSSAILALPVQQNRQAYGTNHRHYPFS